MSVFLCHVTSFSHCGSADWLYDKHSWWSYFPMHWSLFSITKMVCCEYETLKEIDLEKTTNSCERCRYFGKFTITTFIFTIFFYIFFLFFSGRTAAKDEMPEPWSPAWHPRGFGWRHVWLKAVPRHVLNKFKHFGLGMNPPRVFRWGVFSGRGHSARPVWTRSRQEHLTQTEWSCL